MFFRTIFLIIQLTWGIIATFIGFVFFLFTINKKHCCYHGVIKTKWNLSSGLSLGLFIFVPNDEKIEAKMSIHEYGHSIQNLIFGPLYLIIFAIPSFIWAGFFTKYRKKNKINYYSIYPERCANYFGKLFLKEE